MYIPLITLHGLVRGENVEMGRDADTGGQIRYVLELARELARRDDVERVDVFTRMLDPHGQPGDPDFVGPEYSVAQERLLTDAEDAAFADKCHIVRLPCGENRYLRKELLWPILDEFTEAMAAFLADQRPKPQFIHGHYADGGQVAADLADRLGVPFVFTGHSLGLPKLDYLKSEGWTEAKANEVLRMQHRVGVERDCLRRADLVIASTRHEQKTQYGFYDEAEDAPFEIIPPGTHFDRFVGYSDLRGQREREWEDDFREQFDDPDLPLILSVARPDRRKNLPGLLTAYGESDLPSLANLAILAGTRDDIAAKGENEREVLTELLVLRDKYELERQVLLPKHHESERDVPALYRLAARTGGVFVNSAFIELFGLTAIEASACGLPFVATQEGGPAEIVERCGGGVTVDVTDHAQLVAEIRKLLTDRGHWNRLSRNGELCTRETYSWTNHCEEYLAAASKLTRHAAAAESPVAPLPRSAAVPSNLPATLVLSDIDGTLTGEDAAIARLQDYLADHPEVVFGVASGRTHDSAVEVLREMGFSRCDVVISSVGSEVRYGFDAPPDPTYSDLHSEGWAREAIVEALSEVEGIHPQEGSQNAQPFKVSFDADDPSTLPELLPRVDAALRESLVPYALIASAGRHIDVLPAAMDKGAAVLHVARTMAFPLDHVIVAGDTGNDRAMLTCGVRGVVVANRSPELYVLTERDDPTIYLAGEAHAAGVLEGIRHHRMQVVTGHRGERANVRSERGGRQPARPEPVKA